MAKLIDEGIVSGNSASVTWIGIEMLGMAIIGSIGAIIGSWLSAELAAKFGFEIRNSFFDKVQLLSIKDTEEFGTATLLTRMTNDVDNIQRMLVLFLQMILPAPIISIFAIIMTYLHSPKLAMIPLLSIIIYGGIATYLLKKGVPFSNQIQKNIDRVMVTLREFFNGITMIRAFDNQDYEEKRTNQTFEEYGNSMIRVNQIFAWLTPVAFLIMGVVFALIIWFGGVLIGFGEIEIGIVTAVIEYSMLTLAYLMMAAMVLVTLPQSLASLKRLEEVLGTNEEIKDYVLQSEGNLVAKSTDQVMVNYHKVTFSYDRATDPVLENIDFTILKGKTTAIVGGTGSGKSTVAKLLLRLSDVNAGSVVFDGIDIRNLSQADLRSRTSYVPQKAFLFSGTIESNLRMGKPDATTEELAKALDTAQATEFIASLKDGMDSFVAQGGDNFSGGQKQRLCIARALIKPADIYIFDDSFSALDYKTDVLLRQALKREMGEKTLLIVAQRLSTIQEADQIIVLDDGRIVGKGTHQELVNNNQTYQEFAASQGMIGKGEQ